METDISNNSKPRPPVVVVMGHVDHGKTTLLDYIRKSNIAEREAGGITQAVGAYEIIHGTAGAERKITFIDTPGHEAFVSMRSRGAAIADLAILVVASDEGVKPQTKEAIDILQKSETPFVVAITKIDKPGANVQKTKDELTAAGVLLEGYGGQISFHGVSAKTGEGVNDLLDLVLLVADVEGLVYDPALPASGFVLEVRKDRRRGTEVSLIVKDGALKKGDIIKTPSATGRVKILENFLSHPVTLAEPSAPARIIGFDAAPSAGEPFQTGEDAKFESKVVKSSGEATTSRDIDKDKSGKLRLILKTNDFGSLEALSNVVQGIKLREMKLQIIGKSVGDVIDGDINDAIATDSSIFGFKVRVEKSARNLADAHKIKIMTSEIVYEIEKAIEDLAEELSRPPVAGALEVLAIFNQNDFKGQLVGGRIIEGTFRPKAVCEITRVDAGGEKIVGTGKVLNLRDKKADVTHAEKGKEAGVLVDVPIKIEKGDKLVIREKR